MINRRFFFDHIRVALFGGEMKQSQVDGLNMILDEWEAKYWNEDDRWLAYCLATQHHECDRTCQPITEYASGWSYDISRRPDLAKLLGNTEPGDGPRFHGRGYVQLTGRANYTRCSPVVGFDLVADPELALEPKNAATIMFYGMINGIFTGRKLADYFNEHAQEPVEARRIINRLDKANTIASYWSRYYAAISYTN